jgi:hypothetical protein
VYTLLYQQVQQFRKQRGIMAIRDIEAAERSYDEIYDEIFEHAPRAVLLRKLARLTPEERLAGLPPEERLAGLTPEQILSALTPEAREELAKKLPH